MCVIIELLERNDVELAVLAERYGYPLFAIEHAIGDYRRAWIAWLDDRGG